MRIIAGEYRSRRLYTPADGEVTRPIPDRVKESLFGMLRGHCEGANVFDGFAGTGAIGLEAVSRGAARCVLVESDREIVKLLKHNVETLGCGDRCEVFQGDALGAGALARAPRPLTLAFLDPPYPLVRETIGFRRVMAQLATLIDLLTPDGFAVLRTPWPLMHDATAGEVAVPFVEEHRERTKKDKRGEIKRGRSWRRYADNLDPTRAAEQLGGGEPVEEDDALEPEVIAASTPAPPAAAPKPNKVAADMRLPNAVGPETHVYHGMAVHLYARKPAATPTPATPTVPTAPSA